jgi:hypothetical protein
MERIASAIRVVPNVYSSLQPRLLDTILCSSRPTNLAVRVQVGSLDDIRPGDRRILYDHFTRLGTETVHILLRRDQRSTLSLATAPADRTPSRRKLQVQVTG